MHARFILRAWFATPTVLVLAALFAAGTVWAVDPNVDSGPAAGEHPADYGAALPLVKARRFEDALPLLRQAEAAQPFNADVLNQLGFTLRKLGRLDEARVAYDRALSVAPNHRGAREYRGELFVQTGEMAAARAELAVLERICGQDCEEYRDLAAAIEQGPPR